MPPISQPAARPALLLAVKLPIRPKVSSSRKPTWTPRTTWLGSTFHAATTSWKAAKAMPTA